MFGKGSKKSAAGSSSAKGNQKSTSSYAASTTSEKESKRAAVSLDAFNRTSQYVYSEVATFRVVVHNTGNASKTKDGRSTNHWSIFLLLAGRTRSVRLNMSNVDGSDELGTFGVTDHDYLLSFSHLSYFDFTVVPGKKVHEFCDLIVNKRRNRYVMTGLGNGCRHWVWYLFNDFLKNHYFAVPEQDYRGLSAQFYRRLALKYHRDGNKVYTFPSEIEMGQFV
ncbi:hypothetical protein V495_05055 [Pseudogymnoascus sp. VKM F-4514 (FW-929)]|nr:hypothetical protein V495_05055 [Pseudogymnoascus sp. VKM F-4514 (FW-929)]KFY53875.1 hypothetical protein V497_08199 [Pseudogymnoascus sp. VKM F-4516 (FW-969)]